jgi:hypothetical protein
METPVALAILAIVGSATILAWPILVMIVRAGVEARRWRNRLMGRAWISAWFAGSGIWVVAAWIAVIIVIRLVTSTVLSQLPAIDLVSWLLVISAMVAIIPFAVRKPREMRE